MCLSVAASNWTSSSPFRTCQSHHRHHQTEDEMLDALFMCCVFRELYFDVVSGCGKVEDGPAAVRGKPWRYMRGVRKIITSIHSSAPQAALQTTTTKHPTAYQPECKMAAALNTVYKLAVPLAIGVQLASMSMYDVKGGTRAVIFDRLTGVKDQVVNEGTHFLIPWLQKSIIYDVRTKPRNISTTTGSKDLQMVSLTLRVLSRPDVKQLPKIYQV